MESYGDPFAPGLLLRLAGVRRVAIVRASRIGDFICATPALRALRAGLPDAEITLIAMPFVADLAARSPHVDRFVPFPGFPGMAEQFFDARRAVAFFAEMQAGRFDLAVQLHGSGVYSNPFTLLLGARATAGFVRSGDGAGRLDAALPWPAGEHEVRRALALATFLGAPARGEATEYPLWDADHAAAAELLAGAAGPLIGIHPAARAAGKRWPPAHFADAGAALVRRHGGTLVVLGSDEEREACRAVGEGAGVPYLDLAGRTALGPLGAVIGRLSVLLTNDSGPAHVAYALGTPAVTIFGETDPREWGALDAARHRMLAGEDVAGVPAERVVAAAEEVMRVA